MMRSTKIIYGIALALTCILAATLKAQNLYVTSFANGTTGKYTTAGATVNASLISGLQSPSGIAISGTNLFVANFASGTVGHYTTDGATINASLISGLNLPCGIAIYGNDLFVANSGGGTTTGQQLSLRTKDEAEAHTLLHSKNEAHRQPVLNLHIARTYLTATDPEVARRTWQVPMDEMTKTKTGSTRHRHEVAMKDKAFDLIRNLPILETHSAHFLKVLELGTVSTNVYLRRIHNFALDMNWLPWPVLPRKQWPQVRFKEKRAITLEEHQRIIAAEVNPERKNLYQLCWHLGASQGDIANLKGEDVDWKNSTVSFIRKKTGVPVLVHLGSRGTKPFQGPARRRFVVSVSCERARRRPRHGV